MWWLNSHHPGNHEAGFVATDSWILHKLLNFEVRCDLT